MEEELKEQKEYIRIKISSFLLHPLCNINITKYFSYKPRFNGVFSRNNLPRITVHVINLDGKKNKEKHWVLLFTDRNTAVYFNSFGTEYNSQEVLNKIRDKVITHADCFG